MIKLYRKIPRKVTLAFSGGIDSVAIFDFLKNNHDVDLLYVDHRTEYSPQAANFARHFADFYGVSLTTHAIARTPAAGESKEDFWRNERYKIFHSLGDSPIITGHHLDDVVETWIWSSMHGEGKLIPYRNQNVIRPFLLTKKSQFRDRLMKKGLDWIEDPSNSNVSFVRNRIRHKIVPELLKINPGIHKTMFKKLSKRMMQNLDR